MDDTIVLYPATGRGHLVSMIELAKLIAKHHTSIKITIILLTPPNETISTSSIPSINFIHLPPTSLPPPVTPPSFRDIVASFFELPRLNNPNLHQTLLSLSKTANIKAFVIDFFCNSAVQVSSTLNIPTYYFYTSNANGLCHFLYSPTISENIPDSLEDLDIVIDTPGIPSLSSKVLPPVMLDRSHKVYQYFIDTASQMAKSAGLLVNTFESLESRAIKAIIEGKCTPDIPVPPIYCIGPIVSSRKTKEEHECLAWLDSQPSRSVVFLSFGSMGAFSATQLKEMAIGLEKTGVNFLWVVRNPPENGQTSDGMLLEELNLETLFPEGFLERTKERGFLVKQWAPQVAILNHDSVGLFVTHCGWNSILESLCAGVPMLAWPLYAEQKMNSVFLVEEMKMALPVNQPEDGFVSGEELEQRLTELMNSEKGQTIQKRVIAMKEAAAEAASEGGSSRFALAQLVDAMVRVGKK
ncbi:hypothetical protein JCGZ_26036 [Jatropha curcas]|uniref:Glycosyltransferase n=1 Tax=Jatropha curcas TaxID=180498 RepID=A0A067JQG0_JATCU|nr:UDP-glycosyltransferase 88B1 [Jatropha curcas]KDP22205.1 hypothetical protein JCGZ_26036 [Jatropha curcas]